MDKINRLEQQIANRTKITYGNGIVTCETNGEIAAFEINYVGAIRAIKKLGDGWTIKIGRDKMIIFSMAETPITEELFTYIGSLEILSCICVTWNEQKHRAAIKNLRRNEWANNFSQWQSDARKPEEIDSTKFIKKRIKKSVI